MEPTRNLLILENQPSQDSTDWIAVKQRIDYEAPDIEVRIASVRQRNSVTARWQVRRPSLVFSPLFLFNYNPRGGAVFCGHFFGKEQQLRRLSAIGILTPQSATLSPRMSLDPREWGEYAIIKPDNSNSGKGVKLVRTDEIAVRHDEFIALADEVGFGDDRILVQPFIEHSEDGYPTEYRVLTVFGRAIYCARNRWGSPSPPIADIAADPLAWSTRQMGGRTREICNDAEIIALGERAHQAFPECAVLGVDIIRDSDSGRLYVLEVNPHGDVWHLSSTLAKKIDPQHVRDRYTQFNALGRVADLLIEKTRSSAV